MANTLVQMSLTLDIKPRLTDERRIQVFRIQRSLDQNFVLEFQFNSKFDDRLCREVFRHVVASIIVKCEVSERENMSRHPR